MTSTMISTQYQGNGQYRETKMEVPNSIDCSETIAICSGEKSTECKVATVASCTLAGAAIGSLGLGIGAGPGAVIGFGVGICVIL